MEMQEIIKDKEQLEQNISSLIATFYNNHQEFEIDVNITPQYIESCGVKKLTNINVKVTLSV